MSLSRIILSSAILGLAPLAPAGAADLDLPVFVEDAPEMVPVEIGSGWYLRGDVSYGFSSSGNAPDYRTFDRATATYSAGTFATSGFDAQLGLGIGVGYQFNRWFRADATLDRFSGSFGGTTTNNPPCISPIVVAGYAGTNCRSEDSADYAAWSLMANGYVDLGTYFNVTPYVGAGAGITWLNWDSYRSSTFCTNGTGTCPAPGVVATANLGNKSQARFAYALMAGLAIDITRNMKVDLGYRYRRIAGGAMAGWDAASGAAGATGNSRTDKGLSNHEVNIGLRYEIW